MAVEVLLGFEFFLAERALEAKRLAVGRLVPHHVGLLDEGLAANVALVGLITVVHLIVPVQAELLREVLVADLAVIIFVLRLRRSLADLVAGNGQTEHFRPEHLGASLCGSRQRQLLDFVPHF